MPHFSPSESTEKTEACCTNRSNLHTAVPSQDTEAWGEQRADGNNFYFSSSFLTKTIPNLSSSSPGSGMGSLRGMLCPLKSVCWFMLPAFPMVPLWSRQNFLPVCLKEKKRKTILFWRRWKVWRILTPLWVSELVPAGFSRSLLLQHKTHEREATLHDGSEWLERRRRCWRNIFLHTHSHTHTK